MKLVPFHFKVLFQCFELGPPPLFQAIQFLSLFLAFNFYVLFAFVTLIELSFTRLQLSVKNFFFVLQFLGEVINKRLSEVNITFSLT